MLCFKALVTRGIETRFSAQGFHFQAAVIRNNTAMGQFIDGPRFQDGVLLEGGSGFLHLKADVLLALGENPETEGFKNVLVFPDLPFVIACNNQFHNSPP